MKLNGKITSLLVIGVFFVSAFLTVSSVLALNNNQNENIRLFKEEFLELGRESFTSSSNLFFDSVSQKIQSATASPEMLATIQSIDPENTNLIVYDITQKKYLLTPQDTEITSLLDANTLEKDIQENILNLKTTFDFDNFQTFLSDASGKTSPAKIQLRFYTDRGFIIGYAKSFSTAKVRIEFIQRKNNELFQSFIAAAIIAFIITLVVAITVMIFLMQSVVLKPLWKITEGLKQVKKGILNTKIDLKSKDEIGDIAAVFNTMTEDLEKSRNTLQEYNKTLEQKVGERTTELNAKLDEVARMNNLMVGRELRMAELKQEIEALKKKISS